MKYRGLSVDQARARRWDLGRAIYGGSSFVGDPLEESYYELLDWLNYAEECARQEIFISAATVHLIRTIAENTRIQLEERSKERCGLT